MNLRSYWYGDESSYYEMDAAVRRVLLSQEALPVRMGGNLDEFGENPISVEVSDGVALMSINGSMLDKSSWFSRFLGFATYEDIQERLVELSEDKEVKTILQVWDSPGGMAAGCQKNAEFIRKYAEKVKPVYSFTEGIATSAAQWAYSAGLLHFADPEAQLGSVGVIAVHSEYTEMDKMMGITRKVFRSAPYKALGGPAEKLSEEGEKVINDSLDKYHNKFVEGLATLNDIPRTKVDNQIANGKVFEAGEAKKLGLVDKLLPLEEVMRKLTREARPRK